MPKITPIKNRVLIKQAPSQERVGKEKLLLAPQGSETWPTTGTVVAVGPGVQSAEIVPGVRVYFERKPSSAIVPDTREGDPDGDRDLIMLPEDNVLAVIED
jgi:co-chaperonin GroES (HSP10)